MRPFPTVEWTFGSRRITAGARLGGDGGTLSALVMGTPRVGFAAEMGFLNSRPESRADALAGMDDRDRVATVGGTLSYFAVSSRSLGRARRSPTRSRCVAISESPRSRHHDGRH